MVTPPYTLTYLIVGGGGSGGLGNSSAGGGGFLDGSVTVQPTTTYKVVVGAGGGWIGSDDGHCPGETRGEFHRPGSDGVRGRRRGHTHRLSRFYTRRHGGFGRRIVCLYWRRSGDCNWGYRDAELWWTDYFNNKFCCRKWGRRCGGGRAEK